MPAPQPLPGHRRRRFYGGAAAAVLLLSLLFSVEAQSPSSSSGPYPNGLNGARFNPAMAIIIVVLISAFFFMGFFSIYIRQCSEGADRSIRPAGLPGARSRRAAAAPRGLDPALIETFPTLVYADVKEHKIGKGALECAVCLSEFDDDDTLRLLPKCDHVFHSDCIDAWLSAHTTCPVCRANLALDIQPPAAVAAAPDAPAADDVSAAVADAGSDERQREEADDLAPSDHVAIAIDEPAAAEASAAPPPVAERVVRVESKSRVPWRTRSLVRVPRFPRSHSTGHSMAVVRPGQDCERYTLRLPDHIRRDIMAGKLQRSSSCAAFPTAGEGSMRKGAYGGGGSIGGRSFKLRKWDWMAKSDRWAFFTRTFSMRSSRGEPAAEGSTRRGEGSTRRGADGGGDAAGEGSFRPKVFPGVRSPFDCLSGGANGGGEDAPAGAPSAKVVGPAQV